MSEARPVRRKRQITGRMRLALLICAAAAAAIPVIVYFATATLMERQEHLSNRLISSMANSAELNATLIRIADETDRLGQLDVIAEVEGASASALARLDDLLDGFAEELPKTLGHSEAKEIADQLSAYKLIISEVADNRTAQLGSLEEVETRRTAIHRLLREANTNILSNTAAVNARFEQRISDPEAEDSSNSGAILSDEFQKVTLYHALTQLLYRVEERVADIDPATPQGTEGVAAKLRFLTRGLATRIAKIPDADLRVVLAKDLQALDLALLGPTSIVIADRDFRRHRANGERIAGEQTKIAAKLLKLSEMKITSSKAEAVQSSNDIANLVGDNRLAVLGLSGLLLLVLFGLLFYVVGRGFSRRIGKLTDGVLAIAHGDIDHDIEIGGNDELTDMGDALHVFRRNRRNLFDVNEELHVLNGEVREAGMRLQTVLDTTTSGIIAFDRNGDIIMLNSPARHFLGGISMAPPFAWPESLNFLGSSDLAPLEASKSPIRRALAGQNLKSEIALLERAVGEEARYMRISSATVQDTTSPVRCVVVIEDVSEAEKNRQQVERAGRLDALGQLTGGIAHDFNNLLATIEYALELSTSAGVSDDAEGYLRTAVGSVRRGSELTARLLSFAKRQPGRAQSQKVSEIMREFRALVEPSIEAVLALRFEEQSPDMYVYCDGGQLENALLNLVLNSRDAILREGVGDQIVITAREVTEANSDLGSWRKLKDEAVYRGVAVGKSLLGKEKSSTRYIEFAVADNGPGMSDEVRRRALDPFFTTKDTNSGTGLGLSMVYGFIQNSEGELLLYTEEGHGTTVRLLLPSGSPDGEREGPVANLPVRIGNGERILIVEDDVQLRQMMADLVGSLGYTIQVAGSGREAMQLFQEGFECAVLLTDIVMPGGIGGFELGEEVRRIRPVLPIIYMSGYSGFTETEMGTAIGTFVQKPCAPSVLSHAIAEALRTVNAV